VIVTCDMQRTNRRWAFCGTVALSAVLVTWVLLGESSPLADYFLFHVAVPNFWRLLNALPFIAAALIGGNRGGGPAALFTILQFVQWFVVAYGLSILFSRAVTRRRRASYDQTL
jgi:hypothetical protein